MAVLSQYYGSYDIEIDAAERRGMTVPRVAAAWPFSLSFLSLQAK